MTILSLLYNFTFKVDIRPGDLRLYFLSMLLPAQLTVSGGSAYYALKNGLAIVNPVEELSQAKYQDCKK